MYGVSQDITRRMHADTEIRRAKELAEAHSKPQPMRRQCNRPWAG